MGKLARRTANACLVGTLSLAALTAILWFISGWYWININITWNDSQSSSISLAYAISIDHITSSEASPGKSAMSWRRVPFSPIWRLDGLEPLKSESDMTEFINGLDGHPSTLISRTTCIQWWFLLLLLLTPSALRLSAICFRACKARMKKTPNACPKCGYDMRASPELCPECGTPRTRAATP